MKRCVLALSLAACGDSSGAKPDAATDAAVDVPVDAELCTAASTYSDPFFSQAARFGDGPPGPPTTILFHGYLDRTPSSRGGWNYGSRLVFPGDRLLPDTFFGSNQNPNSEYVRLTKHLRERLGDRFVVEEKV